MLSLKQLLGLIVFFLASLCISLQSCEREEAEPVSNPQDEILTRSEVRDSPETKYDVPQRMAEIFISSNKENPPIVSVEPYGVDSVTCFYIFNFEKGFKVVSADTRVSPVLAESENENLDPAKVHDGLKVWMEDTADRIRALKINGIDTGPDYSEFWSNFAYDGGASPVKTRSLDPGQDYVWIKTVDFTSTPYTIYANIPHLLDTKWGQDNPWNTNMPSINGQKCLTGCAAVAISQVLYYFHQMNLVPNDLWHSISISNFNLSNQTVTLSKSQYTVSSNRWSQMPLCIGFVNSPYVSDLMLDIGERVHIHYGLSNSYVDLDPYDYHIPNISQCGINASYGGVSFSTIKSDLINSKPLIVVATTIQGAVGSHVWVIDGCEDFLMKDVTTATFNYVSVDDIPEDPVPVAIYSNDDMLRMYPNAIDGMQIVTTVYTPHQRVLMNWGYDGVGDDVSYAVLASSDWIYGNTSFKYNRHIYSNITTSQLN